MKVRMCHNKWRMTEFNNRSILAASGGLVVLAALQVLTKALGLPG